MTIKQLADSLVKAHRTLVNVQQTLAEVAAHLQLVEERVDYDLMVMEDRLDVLRDQVAGDADQGVLRWKNLQDPSPEQKGGSAP